MIPPGKRKAAILWLVAATAAWGLSFPIQKILFMLQQAAVPEAGTWFLSSWTICLRSLLAGALLLAIRPRLRRGGTRLEWEQGALLGIFGGLGMTVQGDGLAYTLASTSAFLTQAYCVLLPLWHCLSRRALPGRRLIGCTVLVVWGMAILSGFEPGRFHLGRGESETLLSAVLFTVQIILLELPRYRNNRAMPVTLLMFLGFAVCSGGVAVATTPAPGALIAVYSTPESLTMLAVLAVFCSGFAYLVMNAQQPRVTAAEAGLIYCMEPVFAAAYALFLPAWLSHWTGIHYPNESLTTDLIAGGLLITGANALLQMRTGRGPGKLREHPPPSPSPPS